MAWGDLKTPLLICRCVYYIKNSITQWRLRRENVACEKSSLIKSLCVERHLLLLFCCVFYRKQTVEYSKEYHIQEIYNGDYYVCKQLCRARKVGFAINRHHSYRYNAYNVNNGHCIDIRRVFLAFCNGFKSARKQN